MGKTARMLQNLKTSLTVSQRIRSSFSVLFSHDGCYLFGVSADKSRELKHIPLTGQKRDFGPCGESFFIAGDSSIELFLSGLG